MHIADRIRLETLESLRSDLKELEVLRCVVGAPAGLTVREIARDTGISRATTYRTLQSLEAAGWIELSGSPKVVRPSLRVAQLGLLALGTLKARDAVLSAAIGCAQATGIACSVALYRNGLAIYTDLVTCYNGEVHVIPRGNAAPATTTGCGKALLAFQSDSEQERVLAGNLRGLTDRTTTNPELLRRELQEVRARGFAVSDREYAEDAAGVGFPVFDSQARVAAALGIHRVPLTPELVSEVQTAGAAFAEQASQALGYRPHLEMTAFA